MEVIGLPTNPQFQNYLKEAYDLDYVRIDGFPAFKKSGTPLFFGGFKAFYSVVFGATLKEVNNRIDNACNAYPEIICDISVDDSSARGVLIHYLLDLNQLTSPEDRFKLYEKKTRNQVRKSYANELRLEVGAPPEGFYTLYTESIRRLKSIPGKKEYFDTLERHLGSSIVCFSLYNGDVLVGCNYTIVSSEYQLLCFNVSDHRHWHLNINNRLYDEMIAWALQKGIRFVDFGPGVRKDTTHNHFKEGFGARARVIVDRQKMPFLKKIKAFFLQKKRNLRIRFSRFFV
ncbi:MAG: hypothetical protein B7X03_03135 [Parcubacteria group bacterium 21-58-10]|nr:MAG: hypothetical protein B7X03_03135 [Parcubacteria group bacterium 21-58-10]